MSSTRADEEEEQIAVLQSAADAGSKSAACQRLRLIGTAKAIPALAALLGDESTSQSARQALEGLPVPEAGAALRAALPRTSGRLQAGVIDSLGWRRERESIPLLVPFLSATDLEIAVATATALGRLGGPPAVAALESLPAKAPAPLALAAQEGLLQCAEQLDRSHETAAARRIYQGLLAHPASEAIRVAAWRGTALTDPQARPEAVRQALAGTDRPLQLAALRLLREVPDAPLLAACAPAWESYGPEAQIAVLEARVILGQEALPTAAKALASPHATVRIAALDALADLGDPSAVPALARAAAQGAPSEREAAREALARVRGPAARDALLACLETAPLPEKAELLRALGERGDRASAPILLPYAGSDAAGPRLAALEALRRLAMPDTLDPLLGLIAQSKAEDRLGPLLQTVSAILQASPDKRQAEGRILETVRKAPPQEGRLLLPLLAELGTPEALAAAQKAARDPDPDLARQAVRVLGQWPNAGPAPFLLEWAQRAPDPALHALALRGGIEVSAQEPDPAKRLALLTRALGHARRVEERRLVLAQLAQIPSADSLEIALKELAASDLVNEAGLTAVSIAEKLSATQPELADAAAEKVLARCKAADTVRRAWALRRTAAPMGPFLQRWVVSGPYRQAGVEGAQAVFDLVFTPEKPGGKPAWKPVPPADHVDLAALFPGQSHCVAYVRTQIVAPDDLDALLLMGSDDGLKAWLNGEVIHAHNVDRGMVVDQDRAPIRLKKGSNQLLIKVTQGGGGWAVCARIVARDGGSLPGLLVESPAP